MSQFKDLTGQKFGRLTVIKLAYKKNNKAFWECECSCGSGKVIIAVTGNLKNGNTKSCGCLRKEKIRETSKKQNKYKIIDEKDTIVFFNNSDNEYFFIDTKNLVKIKEYCWYKRKQDGYAEAWIPELNKRIRLHNFLMNNFTNKILIDHSDRNRNNYRESNLRIATTQENSYNKNKSSRNTSGFIGVTFRKDTGKWVARLIKERKPIILGNFKTKEEAIIARLKGEKEYFGEFAPQKHLFEQYGI